MKRSLLFILLLLAVRVAAQQNNFPHYMTEDEKIFLQQFAKNPYYGEPLDPNPPPGPVRTMAEWEELQALQITWTSQLPILRQIVDYAQDECLVYIICSDSNSVRSYLTTYNIPLVNLKFLITPFNSIWCRDYGPWTVYSGTVDTLRIIDWIYNRPSRPLDNVTPVFISNYMGVPIHQTLVAPNDLVNTGGNFFVDGHGNAFASKLILSENGPGNPYGVSVKTEAQIDSIMKRYMGINRYVKFDNLPYDVIHHIDMHMKMLDEETILVGQYPPGIADGPQIELNLQYLLNNFQSCFGRPYKIVRIPMPPQGGQYPPSGDYRTYTNSVFVNKTVIVPTYELQYDTTALRIYREALPGYRVVGIDCNAIIPLLGAIHCIVKEIGVNDPVFISHKSIADTQYSNTQYPVKAYIKHRSGIANAKVYWSIDTSAGFSQLSMANAGDSFSVNIPPQAPGTKVYYYISASSVSGRTVTKPLTSPAGNFQFHVFNPIGIVKTNTEIPGRFYLYQNYPNPFNPSTNIKFDIPKSGSVRLTVFDITGRTAAELVNEKLDAGTYAYNWSVPSELSSGAYFCRVSYNGEFRVMKILFIK